MLNYKGSAQRMRGVKAKDIVLTLFTTLRVVFEPKLVYVINSNGGENTGNLLNVQFPLHWRYSAIEKCLYGSKKTNMLFEM